MKLGIYTSYSEDIVDFAAETGFKTLELAAWEKSYLDPNKVSSVQIDSMLKYIEDRGLSISCISLYPNFLDHDDEYRIHCKNYFLQVLDLAKVLDVKLVCTFAGGDPYASMEKNINDFTVLFSEFCNKAEKNNIRIAIENCPMLNKQLMRPENIFFSPFMWDILFARVPSKTLGIEFDPAHMIWQHIDYVQAIHDYADKIFNSHAKDLEIRRDVLRRSGILGGYVGNIDGKTDIRWWRGRLPGYGEVDWAKYISALVEIGYQGNLCIEHEDGVFASTDEYRNFKEHSELVEAFGHDKHGLKLGYNMLSKYFA